MDESTAKELCRLTSAFYARCASSFSDTRRLSWTGWQRMLADVRPRLAPGARVLDVACGNLRFRRFLESAAPDLAPFEYYAVDDCPALVEDRAGSAPAHFQRLDIMDALAENALAARLNAPVCDLTAAFGFLHHVPLAAWRVRLMEALCDRTAPGGHIVCSLWQFARDGRMARRARNATARAAGGLGIALDEDAGDFFLGWQDVPGAFRYCHSFSDDEVDALVRALEPHARPVDRFTADTQNCYIVLERR